MNVLGLAKALPVPRFLLGFMLVGAAGCGPSGARSLPPADCYVYVVDWSGSTAEARRTLLGAVLAELEGVPEGTRVVAYRMGSDTQEIYDGTVGDEGVDGVASAFRRAALASDPVPGTDFPKMAAALLKFSRSFPARGYAVRVLTDGGDDRAWDPASSHAYRRDGAALCADPKLAEIAFVGVAPGYREGIRRAFGKAGAKLSILVRGQSLSE